MKQPSSSVEKDSSSLEKMPQGAEVTSVSRMIEAGPDRTGNGWLWHSLRWPTLQSKLAGSV